MQGAEDRCGVGGRGEAEDSQLRPSGGAAVEEWRMQTRQKGVDVVWGMDGQVLLMW